MNCERVRELVSDFLDGRLSRGESGPFRDHMDVCAPCRAFEMELRESLLLLQDLPAVEVGEEFDRAVWSRVRDSREKGSLSAKVGERLAAVWGELALGSSIWKWSPVGVAAGVLVMFGIASDFEPAPGARSVASVPVVSSGSAAESRVASLGDPALGSPVRESASETRTLRQEPASPAASAGDELVAGIPKAVEAYLRSAGNQELRLRSDSERFRRSNYSYPMPLVPAPSVVPVTGRVDPGPGGYSVATGTAVIAF